MTAQSTPSLRTSAGASAAVAAGEDSAELRGVPAVNSQIGGGRGNRQLTIRTGGCMGGPLPETDNRHHHDDRESRCDQISGQHSKRYRDLSPDCAPLRDAPPAGPWPSRRIIATGVPQGQIRWVCPLSGPTGGPRRGSGAGRACPFEAREDPGADGTALGDVEDAVQVEDRRDTGEAALLLCTSFGARHARKSYLWLDRGSRYASLAALRDGIEIRRLWPDAIDGP